ncbi:MAG: ACP S-malonyltransferase [Anaerovoracaceae bacterium]
MSKIGFVFPGQGAQIDLMGKEFFDAFEEVRNYFEIASDIMGINMEELCFEKDNRLNQTKYTQPGLFLTCYSIAKIVSDKGLKADMTAGLSLGEYTAIAYGNSITFEEGILALKARGALMEEAMPNGIGTMAAVLGLEGNKVNEVIRNIQNVTVANYNTPKQIVITGLNDSVKEAEIKLKEAGAKMVKHLDVSGPFHSPFLTEAGIKLKTVLDEIPFKKLDTPYVTNVNGEIVKDNSLIVDLLVKQISSPVMWNQSINMMIEQGIDTFVELGPSKTLTNMIKKINKSVKVYNISNISEMEKVIGELVC